jgi:hypothetical protein
MWTANQKGAKRWAKKNGGRRNTFSLHGKLLKELIVSLVVDARCNLLVVCDGKIINFCFFRGSADKGDYKVLDVVYVALS